MLKKITISPQRKDAYGLSSGSASVLGNSLTLAELPQVAEA